MGTKNRILPAAAIPSRAPKGLTCEISVRALEQWAPQIRAAAGEEEKDNTISVYDVIGFDPWTGGGVTAKRIAAALRTIGKGPVTVNINSPGGDMFEGLAIYNMLRDHPGKVTTKVLGLAASAASIIAMAGEEKVIARAGFLMIHNAWVVAIGNRNDLRETADFLEPFDRTMADIYAAATGGELKAMQKLMDAETFIGGSDAVEQGFADDLLPADQINDDGDAPDAHAIRKLEAALRASGLPRAAAERMLRAAKLGLSDSAGTRQQVVRDSDPPAAGAQNARSVEALSSFSLPSFKS